jgi:hypothetical protein
LDGAWLKEEFCTAWVSDASLYAVLAEFHGRFISIAADAVKGLNREEKLAPANSFRQRAHWLDLHLWT